MKAHEGTGGGLAFPQGSPWQAFAQAPAAAIGIEVLACSMFSYNL